MNLNWIIVGSGDVVNRLVKKSFNLRNSRVLYVYSDDYNQAKKIVKKYNYGKVIKNIKIAIKDKRINCAYIATPPNNHFNYIKLFAKNKINVLCEKPLVLSKTNSNQINNLCEKNNISFYGSFYRREQKRFKFVRNLIKQNKIGKILAFDYKMHHSLSSHPTAPILKSNLKNYKIPWRFNKKISGGGNFLDMGLHVIDFLVQVFGEVKDIQYIKNKTQKYYDVEESYILNLSFKSGVVGQGAWHSTVSQKLDLMNIYGTKGIIQFSFNFKDKVVIEIGGKKYIKHFKLQKPAHQDLIKHVVNIFLKSLKKKKRFIDHQSLYVTYLQNKMI